MLGLLVGSLGGLQGLLVEPLSIGRSMVRCVSGGKFPVPDEVATAAYVFLVLPGGAIFWNALLEGVVF